MKKIVTLIILSSINSIARGYNPAHLAQLLIGIKLAQSGNKFLGTALPYTQTNLYCENCDLSGLDFSNPIPQINGLTQDEITTAIHGAIPASTITMLLTPLKAQYPTYSTDQLFNQLSNQIMQILPIGQTLDSLFQSLNPSTTMSSTNSNINFIWSDANLSGIVWSANGLSQTLIPASLNGANLSNSTLTNIIFHSKNTSDWQNTAAPLGRDMNGNVSIPTTESLNLQGADLSNVSILNHILLLNASKANIKDCTFTGEYSGSVFDGATISNTTFPNTDLAATSFRGATLNQVTFGSTNGRPAFLANAIFDHANLNQITFDSVNGYGSADLQSTSFYQTTMNNVSLENASLEGANLNISVPNLGDGSGVVTNITFNNNTNFARSTASTDLAQWLARNENTSEIGSYMYEQCQAGAQAFCGAFCYMGEYDACHTLEIKQKDNLAMTCTNIEQSGGPYGSESNSTTTVYSSPSDAPCSTDGCQTTSQSGSILNTTTCNFIYQSIVPNMNCNQQQCINIVWEAQ